MHDAYKYERKTTRNGRNRTTKPIKKQNSRNKGNLFIVENIGSEQYKTNGDERKKFKDYLRRRRKLLETELYS